ncbi:TraR/DksA family transcriptional regulator [Vibrio parahaemolyticus]|nr:MULTISPECIES: TraR/DksA family transcriptional regulator [Vibrio]MCA2421846.1 TraR/DksA family transcriptional regulator [Vibrio alginolyticus]MCA2446546.1 TraR/DksA family transcriptional regulator [Vibrio alginolyticus]MCR9821592.1 TraR/DksA family transcriptional regulator [Vibrio parahaemolyticus]MDF5108325.1 TraR/DksA family transcriptional regulator [Vibrio parahaemolyticus]MDF5143231.1 TraR/DksA family transcriptional regulator [Vibrio parahaemolyticus]
MQVHDFLSEQQLNCIREKVSQGIANIQERLSSEQNTCLSEGVSMPDPTDRATLETERSCGAALRNREEKQLLNLRKVLGRLTHKLDEFGFCESCGIEIDYDRLLGVPTAVKCMECQRIEEYKKGQMH